LREVLTTYDETTRSLINETKPPVVTAVRADPLGGLDLELSAGLRMQLFPDGSRGEDWRFFSPGAEAAHFVVKGGNVQS
jgi:hypothetical protein